MLNDKKSRRGLYTAVVKCALAMLLTLGLMPPMAAQASECAANALGMGLAVAREAADAFHEENPTLAITPNVAGLEAVLAYGERMLSAVREAMEAQDGCPACVRVDWLDRPHGEIPTVHDSSIFGGTLVLRHGSDRAYLPLLYEVAPQIYFELREVWEGRGVIRLNADGSPDLRDDLETDAFIIDYIHGPKVWASPNERRAVIYMVERFQEAIDAAAAIDPALVLGAEASLKRFDILNELDSDTHPDTMGRMPGRIGRLQFGEYGDDNWYHDWYGSPFPASFDVPFPVIENPTLVELGVFPNLSVPADAPDSFVAVVRFDTIHLQMYTQLLPVLRELQAAHNVEIELLLISQIGRRHWTARAPHPITRPQDRVGAAGIQHSMYLSLVDADAFSQVIPFMSIAEENLISAIERSYALTRIYRHERRFFHSPLLRLPASDDPDNPEMVIMIGGHLDSVLSAPGVSDNSGSSVAMIETARYLAARDRGGVEFWIFPHANHEAGSNGGIEAFDPGGVFVAMPWDSMFRHMLDEGHRDIAIFYHHDMITSPGPHASGHLHMPISIGNGTIPNWRNLPATIGEGITFNLAQYLLTDAAHRPGTDLTLSETDLVISSGRTTFNAGGGGATEATNANRDHGVMSAGVAGGLELAYHNARDNIWENYCYYRHRLAAEIIRGGMSLAIDQQVTRRADFTLDAAAGLLTLNNADQLALTFDRITGTILLDSADIDFEIVLSESDSVSFTGVAGTTHAAVRNLFAIGEGYMSGNLSTGERTLAPFYGRLTSNLYPTTEHLRARIPGTRIYEGMTARSHGYILQDPFLRVNGVGYISNRAFAELIGGSQHYYMTTVHQVLLYSPTTVSGYDVNGEYVSIHINGWRDTSAATHTYRGFWTLPVPMPTTATITRGGVSEVVDIALYTGLPGPFAGALSVHIPTSPARFAAYLPVRFLANAFGFDITMDGDAYVFGN